MSELAKFVVEKFEKIIDLIQSGDHIPKFHHFEHPDGFEGLIDNDDFINGWFTVRKIKGRHIYKSVVTPKQDMVN